MKRNVYAALTMLAAALMISVPMSQAQSRTTANVPFAFSMNQGSMPAGGYEISAVRDNVIVVRNLDTKEARLLIASMHVEASQPFGTDRAVPVSPGRNRSSRKNSKPRATSTTNPKSWSSQ